MDKRSFLNNLTLAALTTDSGREFQGRTTLAEKNALSVLFFTSGGSNLREWPREEGLVDLVKKSLNNNEFRPNNSFCKRKLP
jgi:hypothetical protein